jgi:SUN domain-containing protein 1/2
MSALSSVVLYHIRAPTASSHSPPKPERSTAATTEQAEEEPESDSEEPALVRFARLKQQEQVQQQQQRPANSAGPRIINTPPNPSRWSVKDTSVNIASAFHQAAGYVIPAYDTSTSSQGSRANTTINDISNHNFNAPAAAMNPNDSWASNTQHKRALPRSTSVEYENQQQAVSRRLANPPGRNGHALAPPPSRMNRIPSARSVPDSEGEEEGASTSMNLPGKTPFEQVIDMSKKLTQMAPTTFFLRRQSEEPEMRQQAETGGQDQSSSYDYSAEEREFQASLQDKSNSMDQRAIARKRNRISVDNKAYKPTVSDMEESDEEIDQDGKRVRRKKSKKGTIGGHLNSLPVLGYDKKRKGRRGAKENAENDSGDEVQETSEPIVAAEVSYMHEQLFDKHLTRYVASYKGNYICLPCTLCDKDICTPTVKNVCTSELCTSRT